MKTNCAENCSSEDEEKGQPFPKNGSLSRDLSLEDILKRLKSSKGELYSYVVDTVEEKNRNFIQTGSAPNYQGGYITLCSCKHFMRTFRDVNRWKDVWIAGISNKTCNNAIFYLMKVESAYESQFGIWNKLPAATRQAKNARHSKFGDIYEPVSKCSNHFDTAQYYKLCSAHVHAGNLWQQDIDYCNKQWKRRAAMLLGDRNYSFIWTKPGLFLKHPDGKKFVSGQKGWKLADFMDCICDKL